MTGNSQACPNVTCLNTNDEDNQNYQNIANSFNNFFLNIANTEKKQASKDTGIDKRSMDYLCTSFQKPFQELIFKRTNSKEIEEIIRLIKLKPASGYDEITVKVIKASAPFISAPLAYIFNKSLSTGIFPTRLKYSEIIPIYKKKETRQTCQTTDPYPYSQLFLKSLRKFYTKECLYI